VLVLHLILLSVDLVRLVQALPLTVRRAAITASLDSPSKTSGRRTEEFWLERLAREIRANIHPDSKMDCTFE
jgi:hypothetical protein